MKRSASPFPSLAGRFGATAVCLLALLAASPLPAARSEADRDRERFLEEARIEKVRTLTVGVTSPLRATLTLDGLTHDAHIQRVDLNLKNYRTKGRAYASYLDCYRFNIAAYRLDRLLDLNMVPVSVERKYRGRKAAVTWWVDDVLMSDADRYQDEIQPPDPERWQDQRFQTKIFNQLVCNTDPNLGNFLIAEGWRLWMVDFTRAFRRQRRLLEPLLVQRIDRRVYEGLRAMTWEELRRETDPYLTRDEARAVMARREAILELLAAKIAAKGEAAVICDRPGH